MNSPDDNQLIGAGNSNSYIKQEAPDDSSALTQHTVGVRGSTESQLPPPEAVA